MKRFVAALMMASGLLLAGGANSAATLTFTESGADVIATFSGSVNTAGLTAQFTGNYSSALFPNFPFILIGSSVSTTFVSYSGVSYDTAWGTSGNFANSSASGDKIGLNPGSGYIGLLAGYVSGSTLNGSTTYTNKTLANLNLTVGTYHITWGSGANADSITVYVGTTPPPTPSAVPTLSEWSQMLLGLLVITMIGWRFHKQRSY